MRNFKELKIWQKGFQLAVNSFGITESSPPTGKIGTGTEQSRCLHSIKNC
jgi:hypothetical protein